jgi:hypothetical protein
MIQSYSVLSVLLKEVVGKIIWSRKCKYILFRFAAVSEFRWFYVDVAFIIVIIDVYEM